jgi:soluble lytic murein transglycosylase-like protein
MRFHSRRFIQPILSAGKTLADAAHFAAQVVVSPAVLLADLLRAESSLAPRWVAAYLTLALLISTAGLAATSAAYSQVRRALSVLTAAAAPRRDLAGVPYSDIINMEAARHGLDPALVAAIIRQESRFEPHAVSSAGARGLMQVLPGTWRTLNPQSACDGRHDPPAQGMDCIFTPVANVRTGTAYFRGLLTMFEGNPVMAFAAYNAGQTAVRQYGDDGVTLPPYGETQSFVREVLAYWSLLRAEAPPGPDGLRALRRIDRAAGILPAMGLAAWCLLAVWMARRHRSQMPTV